MMVAARADLPAPGAPARSVSLPRAMRFGHSHWIGLNLSSLARVTIATGAGFATGAGALSEIVMVILVDRGIRLMQIHNQEHSLLFMICKNKVRTKMDRGPDSHRGSPVCEEACFRIYFRKQRRVPMPGTKRKALASYRRRLRRRGVIRLEVHVRQDDAALVRGVVKALADPQLG